MEKRKVGRPLKEAEPGKRASLGLRVTAETKARLEIAAAASGRSQSQEAEIRLEASFRDEAAGQAILGFVMQGLFDDGLVVTARQDGVVEYALPGKPTLFLRRGS